MNASRHSSGETIGEGLYRKLRSDIIFGHLRPGQKLRLDAVGRAYVVSASTLREMLNRLCSEGLVVAEGQRGFEVAPVSATGFREVAAMRLLLECDALQASFDAGDLEWEGRVVSAHHKLSRLEDAISAGDTSASELWKHYDREFHQALVSNCGSEALLETHAAIYDKYLRYQMVFEIYRGGVAAREHRTLLECALRRDIDRAKAALVEHVEGCVEAALARDNPLAHSVNPDAEAPARRVARISRAGAKASGQTMPAAPSRGSRRGRPGVTGEARA